MKVFENNTNFTSMRKIRLLTMLLAVLILPLISGCGKMMSEGEGGWVQVLYSTGNTTTIPSQVNHLLSTKWDQDHPWNQKCPIDDGTHCKVGCVMVAMGQIMYYLNRNFGYPTALYETVYLSEDIPDNLYDQICLSNYNSSSSRWASMATNRSGTDAGIEYVEDFLASLGKQMHADYGSNETTCAYVHDSDFNAFGIDCDGDNYDYDSVISNLNSGKPVFAFAPYGSGATNSHAWVIDGYKNERTYYSVTYKFYYVEDLSEISGSSYNGYGIVSTYTDEEMSVMFSYCYSGMEIIDSTSILSKYFLMNWGENGGSSDNVYYDASNWTYLSYQINNTDRHIFYNFSSL